MKLTHRYDCYLELNEYLSHEYHCELTKEIDDLAGFDKKMIYMMCSKPKLQNCKVL